MHVVVPYLYENAPKGQELNMAFVRQSDRFQQAK